MQFLEHTLANGLEVVAECNAEARSTALGFFVKTGSRDESDAIAGVSHFLEHMVFKGTPSRSADDVNREFDEMGAHYNAFTSEEKTVYYAAVLPEYLGSAVELLADILRPSLREEDFNTEKQVIIEEIRMYDDQPPFGADDRCKALHFGPHPLARSVLGTVESITNLPVAAMREYFQRRYSPGNIVLVAAGKLDFQQLVAVAERACGAWQKASAPRVIAPAAPASNFACVVRDSATQEYVIQLANGPAATDDDRFASKLLATILGDDTGSRLYWELVDPGHAESASLSHHDYYGTGLYGTYLCCSPENTQENLQRVYDVYSQAESEGCTSEEL
ncbi:MAG TPA: pitrilysin family protein, partial [Pirellulales bacterium]|nr:pitrilysin family protein [Pirellulales bacterium]